jgi:pyrimidine-nucleoside phosphorylase
MRESIELLRGDSPGVGIPGSVCSSDLKELTIQLCAHMLEIGGVVRNLTEGRKLAASRLQNGSAWKVFERLIEAQGGDVGMVRDLSRLELAPQVVEWKAQKRGYIARMDTETIGRILVELGGGRKKASDSVDPSVGLVFHRKLGALVKTGEPIATVYARSDTLLQPLEEAFQGAIEITRARKPVPKLVFELL